MMPPEWAPQDWLWIGFPHLAEEWPGYLERAQKQIADLNGEVVEHQILCEIKTEDPKREHDVIKIGIGIKVDHFDHNNTS